MNKINKLRTFALLIAGMFLLMGATSCMVTLKTNNGKHKGWNKNEHNPHHYNSSHPGKKKGKSKHK